ncbi:MAG: hypothetical protein QW641_00675 [Candidatus Aenigmatarchaeota archaeon]
MRIRGIIRDILSIYIGFRIIEAYIFGNFELDIYVFIAAVILLIFGVWFIIERFIS